MGGIEAVLGVGGAKLAGLDNESDESRGKSEQENRIAEKRIEAGIHPHIFRVSRRGSDGAHGSRSLVASSSENFSKWNHPTARGTASAAMKILHLTLSLIHI